MQRKAELGRLLRYVSEQLQLCMGHGRAALLLTSLCSNNTVGVCMFGYLASSCHKPNALCMHCTQMA